MIRVSLLGPPRVELDETLLAFDTRKAVALLAHLALSDRSRPREALADLLWPDADTERARGALRRTLSALRAEIGAELVEATNDHVRLVKGPGLVIDVDRFRSLREAGDLQGAAGLFRGDFLEGFAVRDAPRFEDWVRQEAEALRRELMATLADLFATRETDDPRGALSVARRWLELDPLHEPAHRALMRCYAATGDRAAALVQYRTCVRTLSRDLGVPPLRETTELYEAINRGSYVPAPRVVSPPVPVPGPPVLPLVGRSSALRELHDMYDGLGPDGRVVLVEGEAGIGKTRLAAEFVASVRGGGANVLVGRAFEGEAGLAYAPVTEALEGRVSAGGDWTARVSDRGLAQATRLVPALGARSDVRTDVRSDPSSSGPGAEARFLSGVWEALVAGAAGAVPGVLWMDDAHSADEATLRLLCYGLRRLAGRPLLVLVTWRTPRDHPLLRVVASTARTGGGTVVRLDRLDESEVTALVHAAGRLDADPDAGRRLWERTEGVPLLLVEYLRSGGSTDDGHLPAGANDLLQTRLDPVTETAGQVLSAAAVLGRSFGVDTVRAVSGRTEEETVTSLEELSRLGLVEESGDGYDFAHGLLRSLVYDRTSLARRRLLHGRAADTPGSPAAAVARHLQLAGRDAAAARAFRTAGEQARDVYANVEALEHLRAALALGHPDHSGLHIQIGDLLTVAADYSGALLSLEAAAATCAPAEVTAVEHRLGRLQHRRGEFERAQAHLQAAIASAREEDLAARAAISVDLSLAAHALGHGDRAGELAAAAMSLAEQAADPGARCQAHNLLGMLATHAGDTDRALLHLGRSLELAEHIADAELQIAVLNNLALTHRARGELDSALGLTSRALGRCTAIGDRHHEAALHNNMADLLYDSGQGEAAMRHLKRAVEIFAEIGAEEPRPAIWKLVSW